MDYRDRRAIVQAKKALAEVEGALGMTMRMDGVQAAEAAKAELEAFIGGLRDEDRLRAALELLVENRGGATGDARHFFDNAVSELTSVSGVELA